MGRRHGSGTRSGDRGAKVVSQGTVSRGRGDHDLGAGLRPMRRWQVEAEDKVMVAAASGQGHVTRPRCRGLGAADMGQWRGTRSRDNVVSHDLGALRRDRVARPCRRPVRRDLVRDRRRGMSEHATFVFRSVVKKSRCTQTCSMSAGDTVRGQGHGARRHGRVLDMPTPTP